MAKKKYNVAVVGATGMVGQVMVSILKERNFPVGILRPLASERSAGKKISFGKDSISIDTLSASSFKDIDIALFSAGASISEKFAPIAVKAGAVVIDNSSAFRMDPGVPLVVPEVNPEKAREHKGIIANPNCSTIQLVVVLNPIHKAAGIGRFVISTYQSVSGWGKEAVAELDGQTRSILNKKKPKVNKDILPRQIAFNLIPQIDVFCEDGYTKEEKKVVNETRKILGDDTIKISSTCVRVPVYMAHSESVNIQLKRPLDIKRLKEILSKAKGVKVMDEPSTSTYPTPIDAAGKDDVFVGRIRRDDS
ncbi:MAG: aspartate-semialdehyde dehydrogenase, partial [Candidatus Omnitrophica bacterium CG1_02_49_10]